MLLQSLNGLHLIIDGGDELLFVLVGASGRRCDTKSSLGWELSESSIEVDRSAVGEGGDSARGEVEEGGSEEEEGGGGEEEGGGGEEEEGGGEEDDAGGREGVSGASASVGEVGAIAEGGGCADGSMLGKGTT